jgi:hypothetical protein
LPLGSVGVGNTRLAGKTGNGFVVQPCLDTAVGAYMILETVPRPSRKSCGGGNALRREVRKGSIIGLSIVHQNLALATNSQMLVAPLGRVGHSDKGDVRVGEGLGSFAIRRHIYQCLCSDIEVVSHILGIPKNLHISPDIEITAGDLR